MVLRGRPRIWVSRAPPSPPEQPMVPAPLTALRNGNTTRAVCAGGQCEPPSPERPRPREAPPPRGLAPERPRPREAAQKAQS